MYRLACCDDDSDFLIQMEDTCRKIFQEFHIEYHIDCFQSFDQLYTICSQSPDKYDMMILDVVISNKNYENGIVLGKHLRKLGITASILYVSSSSDYILDGYEVQPLRYLMKPVDPSLLKELLSADYRARYIPQRLIVKKGGSVTAVSYKDILFIESVQRRTQVHTEENVIVSSLRLEEFLTQLPPVNFIRCHQSFILNLSKVTLIRRYEAQLKNNQTVPISKAYYKKVQSEFIQFLRKESSF